MFDIIETATPLLVACVHGILLLKDSEATACSFFEHYLHLRSILVHFSMSVILKILLKKKRILKNKKPVFYIPQTVKYGFPSSHSMFYFSYFLNSRSKAALVIAMVCPTIRILNGHHSISEVSGTFVLCYLLKLIMSNYYGWISDIEISALNTLFKKNQHINSNVY